MKILYVGHTYTIRANQAKIVALAKSKSPFDPVEITLVTPHAWRGPLYSNKTDRFETELAPNVDHQIIPAWFIGKESRFIYSPKIFSLIARIKPDIVHVEQGAYAASYAQILWALKLFSPWSRASFFTWWNLPYAPRGLRRVLEQFNFSHSAGAIAGNEAARDILLEHGFNRQIEVLPQLGIDLNAAQKPTAEKGSNTFTIGYAGRITEEKGVLDLVNAAGNMKSKDSTQLYFIGNGEALGAVKRSAAVRGVRLLHIAAVRNEELYQHLSTMDVLVLPSRTTATWVEQFGHILLEAMASGIPVIGSSSGEIPNVIGNAGLVFEEGNVRELASHLERLSASREEREHFAALGMARISERFTHERLANAQMRLFDWMMQHGASVGPKERTRGVQERGIETAL